MTRLQHDYCGGGIDEEHERCALCKRQRNRHVRIIRDVGRAVLAIRIGRREIQFGRFPSACSACDGTGSEPAGITDWATGLCRACAAPWCPDDCGCPCHCLCHDADEKAVTACHAMVSQRVSGTVTPSLTGEPAPRDIPQPPRGRHDHHHMREGNLMAAAGPDFGDTVTGHIADENDWTKSGPRIITPKRTFTGTVTGLFTDEPHAAKVTNRAGEQRCVRIISIIRQRQDGQ